LKNRSKRRSRPRNPSLKKNQYMRSQLRYPNLLRKPRSRSPSPSRKRLKRHLKSMNHPLRLLSLRKKLRSKSQQSKQPLRRPKLLRNRPQKSSRRTMTELLIILQKIIVF